MFHYFTFFLSRFAFFALSVFIVFAGCTHQITQRGHLFRGDWAIEYNRTPWIGCPPDAECGEDCGGSCGLSGCLTKDSNGRGVMRYRHHCGLNAGCTTQAPCCKTLGCGMWIEPKDAKIPITLGGHAKACGLLPFCTHEKPCLLTPNCGKPVSVSVNPQTLLQTNQNNAAQNTAAGVGRIGNGNIALPNSTPHGDEAVVRGMNPNTHLANSPIGGILSGVLPGNMSGVMSGFIPGMVQGGLPMQGTLVSRGIVPGASNIVTGGKVAAIGVATPAGTMTAQGVRLPNGLVSNALVLRSCMMTPNCTPAHPCGLTTNCGGAVAINIVSNNAIALASTLQAQGMANCVMQAGGMGMATTVHPLTVQPINGLAAGYPQTGYMPMGYAQAGYAMADYPHSDTGIAGTAGMTQGVGTMGTADGEEENFVENSSKTVSAENRTPLPVPRFHPISTKPSFQRKEGMQPTPIEQRSVAKPTSAAKNNPHQSFEQEYESALDQAYLEGVSAAMDEMEQQFEAKRQATVKAELREKILLQTQYVQQQLEDQDSQRLIAQQERLIQEKLEKERLNQEVVRQQQALQVQQEKQKKMLAVSESHQKVPSKQETAQKSTSLPKVSLVNVHPAQLAGNLKTSISSGVQDILSPLLKSNQKLQVRPQARVPQNPSSKQPKGQAKITVASANMLSSSNPSAQNLPVKPSVLSVDRGYGLLPDNDKSAAIQQAQFADDQ